MSLEDITSGSTIADLDVTNPAAGDLVSQADDHIRNLKKAVQQTFMNISATVCSVAAELDFAHKGGTVSGDVVVKGQLEVQGTTTFSAPVVFKSSVDMQSSARISATFSAVVLYAANAGSAGYAGSAAFTPYAASASDAGYAGSAGSVLGWKMTGARRNVSGTWSSPDSLSATFSNTLTYNIFITAYTGNVFASVTPLAANASTTALRLSNNGSGKLKVIFPSDYEDVSAGGSSKTRGFELVLINKP